MQDKKNKNEEDNEIICDECGKPMKIEGGVKINLPEETSKKLPEIFAQHIVEEIFPKFWKNEKDKLRQMSRKEVCKEVFYGGAFLALGEFLGLAGEYSDFEDDKYEEEDDECNEEMRS